MAVVDSEAVGDAVAQAMAAAFAAAGLEVNSARMVRLDHVGARTLE